MMFNQKKKNGNWIEMLKWNSVWILIDQSKQNSNRPIYQVYIIAIFWNINSISELTEFVINDFDVDIPKKLATSSEVAGKICTKISV